MSVEEAKSRLRELAQHKSLAGQLIASPLVRLGAVAIAGAWLGSRVRGRKHDSLLASLASTVARTGLVSAPMLIEHFLRGLNRPASADEHRRSPARDRRPADASTQEHANGHPQEHPRRR